MYLTNSIKTMLCRAGIETGEHPILSAAREGQYDLVYRLLKCGIDPNIYTARSSNRSNTTPLIEAACGDHLSVVELLIQYGADVNKTGDGHYIAENVVTPLMAAASPHRKGGKLCPPDISIVIALLIAGANPNIPGKNSRTTILEEAIKAGEMDLVSMLREFGATKSDVPDGTYYGKVGNTYLKHRASGDIWLDVAWKLQESRNGDWDAESGYRLRQRVGLSWKSDSFISTNSWKILGGSWVKSEDIKQLLDENILMWPSTLPLLDESSIYEVVVLHRQYPKGYPYAEIHSIHKITEPKILSRVKEGHVSIEEEVLIDFSSKDINIYCEVCNKLRCKEWKPIEILDKKMSIPLSGNIKGHIKYNIESGINVLEKLGITRITHIEVQDFAPTDSQRPGFSEINDEHLAKIRDFKNIEGLRLRGAKVTAEGIQHLAGLERLRELNLAGSIVGDDSLSIISKMAWLDRLDISYTKITSDSLQYLSGLRVITDLNLSNTSIEDAGVNSLSILHTLKRLSLSYTSITDASLDVIGNLLNLESLSIDCTDITNNGLEILGKLTRLRELRLGCVKGVSSQSAIAVLRSKIPCLTVYDMESFSYP